MSDFEPHEAIKQKKDRIEKAISLKKPDRTPFISILGINAFQANYAGYSIAEISYDYNKFSESVSKMARDFDYDLSFCQPGLTNQVALTMVEDYPELGPFLGLITAPMHDILQDKYTKWPVKGSSENIAPQFISGQYLKVEEYDQLIENPKKYINEVLLPRVYKSLERPDSGIAYGALIQWGIQINKLVEAMGSLNTKLRNIGCPQARVGKGYNPYDVIADFMRGFDQTIMDFYRVPDKIKMAAEALLPYMLKNVELSASIPAELKKSYDFNRAFVFYPLHLNEFLSPKLYQDYYWPMLKKLLETDIARERIPLIFFEGDHTPHLETLLELPKGKIVAYFERPDWNKVVEILKGHQCIMGGLPPALLISGTPQLVEDHVKSIKDLFKEDGGFILGYAQGSLPREVKKENLLAAINALKKFG